jgi:superoxide reductase
MTEFNELLQGADWKKEKHVPVIEVPEKVKKGEIFSLAVSVGKEIPHPNTTEHHISWIEVYFLAEGEKFPYQIGRCEFSSHGASAQGPNTSTVFTHPVAQISLKTEKSGTIFANSYCNIHGLWKSAKELKTE